MGPEISDAVWLKRSETYYPFNQNRCPFFAITRLYKKVQLNITHENIESQSKHKTILEIEGSVHLRI